MLFLVFCIMIIVLWEKEIIRIFIVWCKIKYYLLLTLAFASLCYQLILHLTALFEIISVVVVFSVFLLVKPSSNVAVFFFQSFHNASVISCYIHT